MRFFLKKKKKSEQGKQVPGVCIYANAFPALAYPGSEMRATFQIPLRRYTFAESKLKKFGFRQLSLQCRLRGGARQQHSTNDQGSPPPPKSSLPLLLMIRDVCDKQAISLREASISFGSPEILFSPPPFLPLLLLSPAMALYKFQEL